MLHVYSDFSKTDARAGFAFVIVEFLNGTGKIIKTKGKTSNYKGCNVTGEILAIVTALRSIPNGSTAFVHTDLKSLPRKSRLNTLFTEMWKQLEIQKKRLDVRILYEEPTARTDFYHWCHHEARIKAGCQTENPIKLELTNAANVR